MIIVQPIKMAVSLDEARNAARINGTDRDGEVETRVRALTAEAEHAIGRAIINQTHRVTLDNFTARIELPVAPVQSVEVRYLDVEGIERTLDPQDYFLDDSYEPGAIVPAPGKSWPETFARINAVKVDAICGYGPDDSTTPAAFKGYIIAKVQEYFAPPGARESPYLIGALDGLKVY